MAQLIIGLLIPASNSSSISANLLLGGIVEAGASQSAQQMAGLKTAYRTKTAPRAIYYGQMIGSFVGIFIATLVYRIYTSVKNVPSAAFGIPDAHMWVVAARLIYQQGLPSRALGFATAAFVMGAVFGVLQILGSKYWWRDIVPSGLAMGIGKSCPSVIYHAQLNTLSKPINPSRNVHNSGYNTTSCDWQFNRGCWTQMVWR